MRNTLALLLISSLCAFLGACNATGGGADAGAAPYVRLEIFVDS
ncbi:MAG: hypothetical protein VYE81_02695 [Planctomycetota bacterium]|nr:hypothetical protein [Planctomycetota bacterium]